MKKFTKIMPTAVLAAASLSLSGCQDEDFGYTKEEIQYRAEFEKSFGKVDPNQNWNLLAQLANGGADVLTRAAGSSGGCTISVLPESLAAPITPEMMKDYSKMLPESNVGDAPYADTNLGRVTQNFSAVTQRVVLYPVYWWTSATDEIGLYYYSDGTGSVSVTDNAGNSHSIVKVPITSNHPEELEYSYVAEPTWDGFYNYNYTSYIPANYQNILNDANIGFVVSNGSNCFNQYGEYWAADKLLKKAGPTSLGYLSTAGPAGTEFDLYQEASAFEIVSAFAELYPEKYQANGDDSYKYCSAPGGTTWASVDEGLATYGDHTKVDPFIDAAINGTAVTKLNRVPTSFRSKGIVVDLPASMKIGFYITNGGNTMYSEGKLNHKKSWSDHSEEIDACYIATYESDEPDASGNPIRYLAFEDWYNQGDYDLNDIVFRVYGLETVIDNEEITEEGLFVCEDLGNFDFDFNDVVLKASWKRFYEKTYNKDENGNVTSVTIKQTPSDELTITAMAAGGDNPSKVYFKTATEPDGQDLGEIHTLFGSVPRNIINAGETYGGDGQFFTFEEDNFPAPWDKTTYPTGYVSQIFGEGYLYIIASTSNYVANQSNTDYNNEALRIITSTGYKTHRVPQMMLLPMYYEWCQENEPIAEVYPRFTDWAANASLTDWTTNGKVESRTTDRGVTPEMFDKTITAPTISGDGGNEDGDDGEDNKDSGSGSHTSPSYGTIIPSTSFAAEVGAPNNYTAFKIESSAIPSDKTLKVTLIQSGDDYVQLYCATKSWGAQMTIKGSKGTAIYGEVSTSSISEDYYICIQQGNAANAEIYYSFE